MMMSGLLQDFVARSVQSAMARSVSTSPDLLGTCRHRRDAMWRFNSCEHTNNRPFCREFWSNELPPSQWMSVQEVKRRNQKKNTKPLKLASCDTRNHVQAYFDLRDNLVHGTFCLGTFSIVGQSVMGQFARDFLSGDSLSWDKLTVHDSTFLRFLVASLQVWDSVGYIIYCTLL